MDNSAKCINMSEGAFSQVMTFYVHKLSWEKFKNSHQPIYQLQTTQKT